MPRHIPQDRFEALLDAATAVFLEQGYRRTQIADVAARMGLCPRARSIPTSRARRRSSTPFSGTPTVPAPVDLPETLPVPTPSPNDTLKMVAERLSEEGAVWAVHRHWDPAPQTIEEGSARRTVLAFLASALVPPPSKRSRDDAT